MEPDNDNNKNYNSENNFKLKGPKGWAHNLKKGVKSIFNNAQNTFKDRMKNVFKVLLAIVVSIAKILLPIIVFLAAGWYVINTLSHEKTISAVSSYISNSTTISEDAKEAYEKSGSLLFLNNEDIKAISKDYLEGLERVEGSLYRVLSNEEKIGDHKISSISYTKGFDISNAYEFILNAERMNFNRVSWKKYDRKTGKITDLELKTDEKTNLKYPKNDEDEIKDLKYFTNLVMSYLQSYIVPSAMLSGVSTKSEAVQVANFAFQIIDKGYSVIDVLQYTLQTAKRPLKARVSITYRADIPIYTNAEGTEAAHSYFSRPSLHAKQAEVEEVYEKAKAAYESDRGQAAYTKSEEYKYEGCTLSITIGSVAPVVEKQYVYPVIKADTLKRFMRAEYEQKKYSDVDVNNYANFDSRYEKEVESFSYAGYNCSDHEIREDCGIIKPADFIPTSENKKTTELIIYVGETIDFEYIWTDKLEEKYNESRDYEVNDISEFVNKTDKVVKVEERVLTEEEKKPGSRPDLRLNASEIFSSREINYYKELEEDEDITRIDMINATPSIYNDYLYDGENYSKYIGFSRSYLSMSYTMLNKHLAELESASKSTKNWAGISIGSISGLELIWPLDSYGTITSVFGKARPEIGQSYEHGAIDITPTANWVYPNKRDNEGNNYTGSYVYAASSGIVTAVFKETPRDQGNFKSICPDTKQGANYSCDGTIRGMFGRYIYIKDDNGYTVIYGHLYEIADGIELGAKVEQGQALGVMGTTGSSRGTHLHFELRDSTEKKIDPLSISSLLTSREIINNK